MYVTVSGNTVSSGGSGGGLCIWGSSPTLTDVTVTGNTANSYGGGLYISGGIPTLTRITASRNLGEGLFFRESSGALVNVTITGNTSGVYVESGTPTIAGSNISYHGTGLFNADNTNIVDADSIWWGDASGPYHPLQNQGGLGDSVNTFVNITPFLTEPDTAAPPIPVQNFAVAGTGNDFISLYWDKSPIGDFAGYKVYYDTDSTGFPYANTVDVGTDTSYTLSGLPLGTTFYLAVTCYDADGNESWYSEEVSAVTRILEVQNLDIGGDENLEHLVTHTPTISFDYYDSMGEPQTSYHIQVSTQSDFSSIDVWDTGEVVSNATTVTYAGNPLGDGLTYYLRVKVASGGFWSDWATLEFRMNTTPAAPAALHPINNEVVFAAPILSVINSTDPEEDEITYRFDLYEDAGLTMRLDSALSVPQGIDTTGWAVTAVLPDNGQYWWTVSAYDGYEHSALSGPFSFLINTENNVPGTFTLISPQINEAVATLTPTFHWSASIDPDPLDTVRYRLYLDSPEPGVEIFDADTATSLQIVTSLSDNTEYQWRVIARDMLGFETINERDYQVFIVNAVNDPPSPVTLITPDSVIVIDLSPNFYWTPSIDPDPQDIISYQLTYGNDGMEIIAQIDLDTNSIDLGSNLEDNSQFWWTVKSLDKQGAFSLSDTAIFWTDAYPEPPSNFWVIFPYHEVDGIEPIVEFKWEPAIDPDPLDFVEYTLVYASDWGDTSTYTTVGGISDTTFTATLLNNTEYYWLVEAIDGDSLITASDEGTPARFVVGVVGIDVLTAIPEEFALHQNYPNPFNPNCTIRYDLPEATSAAILVYDIMGREIIHLVDGHVEPGYHQVIWNGRDKTGREVPTGIYIAKMVTPGFTKSIKMLLLK